MNHRGMKEWERGRQRDRERSNACEFVIKERHR